MTDDDVMDDVLTLMDRGDSKSIHGLNAILNKIKSGKVSSVISNYLSLGVCPDQQKVLSLSVEVIEGLIDPVYDNNCVCLTYTNGGFGWGEADDLPDITDEEIQSMMERGDMRVEGDKLLLKLEPHMGYSLFCNDDGSGRVVVGYLRK